MSDWKAPNLSDMPDIRKSDYIGIDVETRDPNLKDRGPGGVRGDGYIVGYCLSTGDQSWYLPVRHDQGGNMDQIQVSRYVRDMLSSDTPKVGANILYDLEWLRAEGIEVKGPLYDVQVAEPLIDENKRSYRLDALAELYLGVHKEEDLLKQAAQEYGIAEDEIKNNLWFFHSKYVGPYGEADASLPIKIFKKQKAIMEDLGLMDVFQIETDLIPMLLDMRFRGIPIDMQQAEDTYGRLSSELQGIQQYFNDLCGGIDIWSNENISEVASTIGLKDLLKTDKGNPSFPSAWLEKQDNVFCKNLLHARRLDRAGGVFVKTKIIDVAHNGRIHPQFHSLRADQFGTRSGRFSSSGPNMQQVPSRDPYLAPMIRSLFKPESGCEWLVADWSQQEPRVTIHYAYLTKCIKADEAVRQFNDNPATDYHQMVAEMTGLPRKEAKTINLGAAYGMGKAKMAEALGVPEHTAKDLLSQYHDRLPYIRQLSWMCQRKAESKGFIKTFLGRRRNFTAWGPRKYEQGMRPLPREEAIEKWGNGVVLWGTYKAMNSLIQGTSADMIKIAMLQCYKAGYLPHLTIHDELDFSIESRSQAKDIEEIMLNCVDLSVPLKVDLEYGPSWGEAKEIK